MKRFFLHGVHIAAAIAYAAYSADSVMAQLVITEIMFDPPGTDTKHEWIEVQNISSSSIDLNSYRFVESGTSHKISLFGTGTLSLAGGMYAVIADDPATLLADFPSFTGTLFDSTFSLTNTGEQLVLSDGTIQTDLIIYDPSLGGQGTGASLQKQSDTTWLAALPTPGLTNSSTPYNGKDSEEDESESNDGSSSGSGSSSSSSSTSGSSAHSSTIPISTYNPKSNFQVSVGRERLVSINTPIEFVAEAKDEFEYGVKWTFGDGTFDRGHKVRHTYTLPAIYALVANAYEREYDHYAVDRTKVVVFEPKIEVGYATSTGFWLKNKSGKELNLGDFSARLGRQSITWPADTIVFDNQTIPIPFPGTFGDRCSLSFSYPNGETLQPLNCT